VFLPDARSRELRAFPRVAEAKLDMTADDGAHDCGANRFRGEVARIVRNQLRGDYSETLTHVSYAVAPLAYAGFACNRDYASERMQAEALNSWSPQARFQCAALNVFDLGVGDGSAALAALRSLNRAGAQGFHYFGVDLSRVLLARARKLISANRRELGLQDARFFNARFDDARELERVANRVGESEANLVLLFGNTLANFVRPSELLRVLNLVFSRAFSSPTEFLIGLELRGGSACARDFLREYRVPENKELTASPLRLLGFAPNEVGRVEVRFNRALERIEEWFAFDEEATALPRTRNEFVIPRESRILA
jgi:hypothetical protein